MLLTYPDGSQLYCAVHAWCGGGAPGGGETGYRERAYLAMYFAETGQRGETFATYDASRDEWILETGRTIRVKLEASASNARIARHSVTWTDQEWEG